MLFHEFSHSSYLSTIIGPGPQQFIYILLPRAGQICPGCKKSQYNTEALTCNLRNFRSILIGRINMPTAHVVSFPIHVRHNPSLPDPPFTVPVLNKSPRQAHIAPCAVRGAEPLHWWKARVTRWKEIKLKVDIVIFASIARSAITITEKHVASSVGESDVVKKSCLQKWVPDWARNSPRLLQNDPGLPGTKKKSRLSDIYIYIIYT